MGTFLHKNKCLKTCPIGFFGEKSISECKACDSTCDTCSDAYATSCDGCRKGTFLHQGKCVSVCPTELWFGDVESKTCK